MAVVNKMELGRELFRAISQINEQVDEIKKRAERDGIKPIEMRYSNGEWVLVPHKLVGGFILPPGGFIPAIRENFKKSLRFRKIAKRELVRRRK